MGVKGTLIPGSGYAFLPSKNCIRRVVQFYRETQQFFSNAKTHLLAAAKERGEEKKPHCDRMVCECVQGLLDLTSK